MYSIKTGHVEVSKKNYILIDSDYIYEEIDSRMVVARSWVAAGEDIDQRILTSSYKLDKFWGSNVHNVQHDDYS